MYQDTQKCIIPNHVGPMIYDDEKGEIVCSFCATVTSEKTIETLQLENYSVPSPIENSNLSSEISSKDKYDNTVNKQILKKLQICNKRVCNNEKSNNLNIALTEILNASSKIGIKKHVQQRAIKIYKTAHDLKLIRKNNIKGIVIASLYAACRILHQPSTVNDFIEYGGIEKKLFYKNYKILVMNMNLDIPKYDIPQMISKIVSIAEISESIVRASIEIYEKIKNNHKCQNVDPIGLASGIIHVAGSMKNKSISQKKISFAAKRAESTVRRFSHIVSKVLSINKVPI